MPRCHHCSFKGILLMDTPGISISWRRMRCLAALCFSQAHNRGDKGDSWPIFKPFLLLKLNCHGRHLTCTVVETKGFFKLFHANCFQSQMALSASNFSHSFIFMHMWNPWSCRVPHIHSSGQVGNYPLGSMMWEPQDFLPPSELQKWTGTESKIRRGAQAPFPDGRWGNSWKVSGCCIAECLGRVRPPTGLPDTPFSGAGRRSRDSPGLAWKRAEKSGARGRARFWQLIFGLTTEGQPKIVDTTVRVFPVLTNLQLYRQLQKYALPHVHLFIHSYTYLNGLSIDVVVTLKCLYRLAFILSFVVIPKHEIWGKWRRASKYLEMLKLHVYKPLKWRNVGLQG